MTSPDGAGPLTCPRCAISHSLDERFCRQCGMPLVYGGAREEEPITEPRARARKVKPQYARGELVKVGFARNQSEGELMQGLLLEEGIPSLLKRSRGFDVPDFLAAGPRDVLVPETGAETARELLADTRLLPYQEEATELREEGRLRAGSGRTPEAQLAFWVIAAAVVAFGLVWVLYQVQF
ncbi:MAG TPA: hypothetical protein VKA89_09440 [Solirubrobacterales bacterium]|nr:hypothetical protein [Solirubrobacterales bacterium]